jgi:hypothetical protein
MGGAADGLIFCSFSFERMCLKRDKQDTQDRQDAQDTQDTQDAQDSRTAGPPGPDKLGDTRRVSHTNQQTYRR